MNNILQLYYNLVREQQKPQKQFSMILERSFKNEESSVSGIF